MGILKEVALRIQRIYSDENGFRGKNKEHANSLTVCGHDNQHVKNTFDGDANMIWQEVRKTTKKVTGICVSIFQQLLICRFDSVVYLASCVLLVICKESVLQLY